MRHLALILSLTVYFNLTLQRTESRLWPHLYQFPTPHFHILPPGQELSLAPYSLRTRLWAQQHPPFTSPSL